MRIRNGQKSDPDPVLARNQDVLPTSEHRGFIIIVPSALQGISVPDPDPGSGASLTLDPRSGIG